MLTCPEPGCDKEYKRKDHLKRHLASHSQPEYECSTTGCRMRFRRLDLLRRHLRRNICVNPRRRRRIDERLSSVNDNDRERILAEEEDDEIESSPVPPPILFTSPSRLEKSRQVPALDIGEPSGILEPAVNLNTSISNETSQFPVSNSFVLPQIPPYHPPEGIDEEHWDCPAPFDAMDTLAEPWWNWDMSFASNPPIDSSTLFQDLNDILSAPFDFSFLDQPQIGCRDKPGPSDTDNTSRPEPISDAVAEQINEEYKNQKGEAVLSRQFIRSSIDRFWSQVALSFPFIHHGTFDYETSPSHLLLLMCIVGSTYNPEGSSLHDNVQQYNFGPVVQRIRGQLIAELSLTVPISNLQTFFLAHLYDVWMSTSESLTIAQCTWSTMVILYRRKGIGVGTQGFSSTADAEHEFDLDTIWRSWAKEEEWRRAVFCICQMDTHISEFFSQHPTRALSIFAHRIKMPSPQDQWQADSALAWAKSLETGQPLHASGQSATQDTATTDAAIKKAYLPAIHPEFAVQKAAEGWSAGIQAALSPLPTAVLPFDPADPNSAFNVELVLTGLLAVAWDCRVRGGMGIRAWDSANGMKQWKPNLLRAVLKLRHTVSPWAASHLNLRDSFAIAIVSVLSDIPMLQIVAGATEVCGSPIGRREYADAKRRHRLWAKGHDARTCVYQSALYLRQTLEADKGMYTNWAMFLTTLVCWSYITATRNDQATAPLPADTIFGTPKAAYHFLDQITSMKNVDDITFLPLLNTDPLMAAVTASSTNSYPIDKERRAMCLRLMSYR